MMMGNMHACMHVGARTCTFGVALDDGAALDDGVAFLADAAAVQPAIVISTTTTSGG